MRDDEVDHFNDSLCARLVTLIERDSLITRVGVNLVMVGHNLERIADLANNIAEDVRHHRRGAKPTTPQAGLG